VWTLDSDHDPPAWRAPTAEAEAVLAFSTRRGGKSRPPFDTLNLGRSTEDRPEVVSENRRRFLESLGLAPDSLATAGQVHGAVVAAVERPGHHPGCDVLVTRVPGITLTVTAADCLPLLLTARGGVAAAHSGWRGTVAGAPRAALRALCATAQVPPAEVVAHLGPSIRSCCYRVGPEVARQFAEVAITRHDDAWHLDLVAAARFQLIEAGVPADHIHEVPACTACDSAQYFSHRRDGGRTGRHWGVAALCV
jgi:hypothetical protein